MNIRTKYIIYVLAVALVALLVGLFYYINAGDPADTSSPDGGIRSLLPGGNNNHSNEGDAENTADGNGSTGEQNGQGEENGESVEENVTPKSEFGGGTYLMLKDVGEPYLDRFGLGPSDFNKIKAAGFDIIESNFDICAPSSDVLTFLEGAKDAGLKVVMTAGAGEAEWGYPCDEQFSSDLKPHWEKDRVQAWVKKWSYHQAIFAWDISNEGGQNFPNAADNDGWENEGLALTTTQLQQAYRDVKAADPSRPVMIRMNGWYFYDYDSNFFRAGNAFGPGVADIVMVNAYSNVDEYYPDLVTTVATRAHDSVRAVNPNAKIIVALGAWGEQPMWFTPSIAHLNNDFNQAKKTKDLLGVAIFKYGAEDSDWWMVRDASQLWNAISSWKI